MIDNWDGDVEIVYSEDQLARFPQKLPPVISSLMIEPFFLDVIKSPDESLLVSMNCIYFLMHGSQIVRIGRSESFPGRLNSHVATIGSEFDSVLCMAYPSAIDLSMVEPFLTRLLEPKLNVEFTHAAPFWLSGWQPPDYLRCQKYFPFRAFRVDKAWRPRSCQKPARSNFARRVLPMAGVRPFGSWWQARVDAVVKRKTKKRVLGAKKNPLVKPKPKPAPTCHAQEESAVPQIYIPISSVKMRFPPSERLIEYAKIEREEAARCKREGIRFKAPKLRIEK